ncbi:helix-turn-helix transcriptional regulator, partial [Streptomyces sp. NPDC057705]
KLMQTLGATSRTHLGALLVESGIVEAPGAERTLRPNPARADDSG